MTINTADKVAHFFSKYPLHSYDKGEILIQAEEDQKYIFYVVTGKVRQYDISSQGDEIVVNVYKSGAFFPMLNPITGKSNKYFFDAETKVETRIAPAEEVIKFLKTNADVAFDLLTRLYIGVDGLLGRMVQLMSTSAHSRLLYELIIECQRFGKKDRSDSYTININESDLAARAGLSRETISREMQKLVRSELIEVGHKSIVIKNLEELEQKLASAH